MWNLSKEERQEEYQTKTYQQKTRHWKPVWRQDVQEGTCQYGHLGRLLMKLKWGGQVIYDGSWNAYNLLRSLSGTTEPLAHNFHLFTILGKLIHNKLPSCSSLVTPQVWCWYVYWAEIFRPWVVGGRVQANDIPLQSNPWEMSSNYPCLSGHWKNWNSALNLKIPQGAQTPQSCRDRSKPDTDSKKGGSAPG